VQALDGIRVIDMATVIAAPGAARYLADFGADVVKVEPPGGDGTRRMGWRDPRDGDSYMWKLVARGKRAIVLDLKTDDGLAHMRTLLAGADVLIENLRPGTLERLGLAPDDLLATNPGLVVLRVTGFGQTGPYAQRPGFATMAEAMSGFAAINGEPDGAPLPPPIALTDEVTALAGAFAVMVALRHRDRTGEGQVVDVNLLDTMLSLMGPLHSAWAHLGYEQPRLGSGIPYSVPRGTYRCQDGRWIAVSASAESVAARLMDLLGVGDDPRFASFESRAEHRAELDTVVREWVGARDHDDVIAAFEAAHAAIAPVYSMADVAADEHIRARASLVTVDGVTMPGLIARFSRTPGEIRGAGRALGADTDAVLAELDARADDDAGRGRETPRGASA
jgi:crotonobetainyl-CoA:carnitine CoA-transferase CaiB-like acyl-CoA transferase